MRDEPAAPPADRLAMLRLALDGAPDLVVDERELEREPPSYTVDTLAAVRAEEGDSHLHFMLGADAFAEFEQWHRWREILELAHLVVTRRPGAALEIPAGLVERVTEDAGALAQASAGRVLLQPVTQLEISATAIRRLAAAGGDLRYLMPEAARQHLQRKRLYRGPPDQERSTG